MQWNMVFKTLTPATGWMGLETIMLNEINQSPPNK